MIGACGFRQYPDPPLMCPIKPGLWQLECDYAVPAGEWTLMIPCGFLTDLASVPDWVRSLVGTEDLGAVGAIAHDVLYQHGGCGDGLPRPFTRRQTDRLFRDLMRTEGVRFLKRWVGWAAVRVAGWACWRRDRVGMLVERAAAD
jgi:hypothetical protein